MKLPSSWKIKRVADLGEVITGRTPSTSRPEFYGGEYKLISPADLDNGKYVLTCHKRLSYEGFLQCRALPKDTVLVGCIGNVGKLGMVNDDCSATNQQINALICSDGYDPHFVYYRFYYDRGLLKNSAVKTTVPILNKTNFSNIEIPIPPFPEQRRIAAVLSLAQQAIEEQERLITLTAEMKRALMHKLFTEGTRGESQKQTEIGLIPESWKVVQLKETVEYINYGLSKAIPKMPPSNGVNIVSTADITRDGELLYCKIRKIEAPTKTVARLMLKGGDVLFNWRNSLELVGKTTIYDEQPEPHIFASFILRLRCDEINSHNYYIKYLMNHWREQGVFIKLARRAVNQANYNKNEISVLKIPQPDYDEQVEIAETIQIVENRIGSLMDTKNCLQDLFRTLLHKLMTAKICVSDLELAELGIEVKEDQEEAV